MSDLFLRTCASRSSTPPSQPKQEADRLVAASRMMVQAANGLISYKIEPMMLNLVEEELGRLGTGAEREALQREVVGRRHHSDVPA